MIARTLERHVSTISREVRRNSLATKVWARICPCESPETGRTPSALGWPLQAGAPAGPARSGERPPCDGTLSRTDRWPADARTRSHRHQPRVKLPFRLSSLGAEGLLAPPAAPSQIPARTSANAAAAPPAPSNSAARSANEPSMSPTVPPRDIGRRTSCCSLDMVRAARRPRATVALHRPRPSTRSPSQAHRQAPRDIAQADPAVASPNPHHRQWNRVCAPLSADRTTRHAAPTSATPTPPGRRAASTTLNGRLRRRLPQKTNLADLSSCASPSMPTQYAAKMPRLQNPSQAFSKSTVALQT